jgi:hypothetical protein
MQVTDWQAHYKAVRHRLANPAMRAKDRLAAILYDAPIGPYRAKPATRYAAPLGPFRPLTALWIGYVRYTTTANWLRNIRRYAQKVRPRHHLDRVAYQRPIGPHNCAKSVWVRKNKVEKRDIFHVATDPVAKYMPAGLKIIDEVCELRNIDRLDLLSKRRTAKLVRVRQEVCYRLRNETMLSTLSIGRLINRDHTSVIYASRSWQASLGGNNGQ